MIVEEPRVNILFAKSSLDRLEIHSCPLTTNYSSSRTAVSIQQSVVLASGDGLLATDYWLLLLTASHLHFAFFGQWRSEGFLRNLLALHSSPDSARSIDHYQHHSQDEQRHERRIEISRKALHSRLMRQRPEDVLDGKHTGRQCRDADKTHWDRRDPGIFRFPHVDQEY